MSFRSLLFLFFTVLSANLASAQATVLEDFEAGAALPWNGSFGDGTFSVVANPAKTETLADPLMINASDSVGSYTKEAGRAFSLLIAQLDQPLDLTTKNQFKIQVYAPVSSAFLFKLEGTGEALEIRKNIAVTNSWIEYTFDFSAAANFKTINKIILFFDPGVEASSDTYLFDNIVIEDAGICAGTTPNPSILDDFECQRNISYANPGYLDITAVDNPDQSGINTSTRVGRYKDVFGAFHALVMDFGQAIPLQERGLVKLKLWAPVAGRLLFKLERGTSGPVERDLQVTETNTWVEYEMDFSDLAGANYTALVLFINAGVAAGENDIYYIDDIQLVEKPAVTANVIEDFEVEGGRLIWEPLGNNQAQHGTFSIISNPDQTGANTSDKVGSYTKGSSNFSTLTGLLLEGIDLTEKTQLNMQVWAPEGSITVTMQLQSPTQGNKEVTRDITATQQWIDLNFNFSDFSTITDFQQLNLLFDGGTASNNTYYFDNITLGAGTVDPCEGVVPNLNIVDDFDCQRNVEITGGANVLEVINNPDASGINNDPLDKVGKYTDPFDQFSALVFNYGAPIDLSIRNIFTVKIWSPKQVPLGFKLEGGSSPAVERVQNVTTTNQWVEYTVDFSDQAAANHQRLVIFFNFAVVQDEETVYFIDDVEWKRAPLTGCVASFEEPNFVIDNWRYFANGMGDNTEFAVIDNPDKSGINTSDKVGFFLESATAGAATFAGMFGDTEAPIALPNGNKTIRMKVWMDHAALVTMKLERGRNGAPGSGDNNVAYTTPNQWQELTWDFSAVIPDNALYDRITLIFDIQNIPTEDKTYYFDDIIIGNQNCGAISSIFSVPTVEALAIAPNPVFDELIVTNAQQVARFQVYDALGKLVNIVNSNNNTTTTIPVTDLAQGIYTLAGFDKNGVLVANARFVKN